MPWSNKVIQKVKPSKPWTWLLLQSLCQRYDATVHGAGDSDEELEIYDIVLRSNQALIEAAEAGSRRIDFDRILNKLPTMVHGPT